MLSLSKIDALMTTQFDKVFNGINVYEGFNYHVWSDGGEWPLLETVIKLESSRNEKFDWLEQPVPMIDIRNAVNHLKTNLMPQGHLAIAMKCGTGKSTKLLAAIIEDGISSNIVCIEPSFLVADQLVDYTSTDMPNIATRRQFDPISKGITYLSVGEFLTLLHSGADFDSSLLVIDEYQSANTVYAVLHDVLSFVKCRILSLTASNSPVMSQRQGVTMHKHRSYDIKLHELIANALSNNGENRTLLLGLHSGNRPIFRSSNHFVGLTPDLDRVIDLGTRPMPVLIDNRLIMTYRRASPLELIQSQGRLGRTSARRNSDYHYIENASDYNLPARTSLYGRVYSALTSAFGLGPESSKDNLIRHLQCASEPTITLRTASSVARSKGSRSISSRSYETESTKTSTSSVKSNTSRITPLREGRERVVSKVSSGYMVDSVPTNKLAKLFDTRSLTWCAHPPSLDVPATVQRVHRSNAMHAHNEQLKILTPKVDYSLSKEDFLEAHEMRTVNQILSGNIFPTYSIEEYDLVNRALRVYLAAGNGKVISEEIDVKITLYVEAFNNIRKIRNEKMGNK